MSRLARHLPNACAALSLVFCASLIALLTVSVRVSPQWRFYYRGERARIYLSRGRLAIDNQPQVIYEQEFNKHKMDEFDRLWARFVALNSKLISGASVTEADDAEAKIVAGRATAAAVSQLQPSQPWSHTNVWLIPAAVAATAALPSASMIRMLRRHRRVSAGACPVCGYDLRSSPLRCPECGSRRT